MVSLDKGLQHLEETGEDLVNIVESSNAESIARAVVEKRQQLFDLLITTRKTTSQLLNGNHFVKLYYKGAYPYFPFI